MSLRSIKPTECSLKKSILSLIMKEDVSIENDGGVIISPSGIFIHGVTGCLDSKVIAPRVGEFFVMLLSTHPVEIQEKNESAPCRLTGFFCFKNPRKIKLIANAKVLILKSSLLEQSDSSLFSDGQVLSAYEHLMWSIFDTVTYESESIENEAVAMSSLLMMSVDKSVDGVSILYKIIDDKYLDAEFNLDVLSGLSFMSRRKVQYILQSKGTSFINELKKRRVTKIKELISSSDRVRPMSYYAHKAGFKNQSSASKAFFDITNTSMRDYISKLNQ